MAELNHMTQPPRFRGAADLAERARQHGEEGVEARQVTMKVARQLIQDRTESIAELARVLEQANDGLFRIAQAFQVREEAARLDRVQEVATSALPPRSKRRRFWKAVEAVVDFDRVEERRVMLEPQSHRQLGRVDRPSPVLVVPARAANADHISASRSARGRRTSA